jgi:D-alanyl-D-alanine dipeptidase
MKYATEDNFLKAKSMIAECFLRLKTVVAFVEANKEFKKDIELNF